MVVLKAVRLRLFLLDAIAGQGSAEVAAQGATASGCLSRIGAQLAGSGVRPWRTP
jgi:hypothetical protein